MNNSTQTIPFSIFVLIHDKKIVFLLEITAESVRDMDQSIETQKITNDHIHIRRLSPIVRVSLVGVRSFEH